MPRRGHKKSRLGCAECKKRHLKCDETKPFCINCKTAGTKCSYEKDYSHLTLPNDTLQSASSSPTASNASNFNDIPIKPIPFRSPREIEVNFDHLELLCNFQSHTFRSFVTNKEIAHQYMDTANRHGLKHPFLMYEILAISSLHLSIHRPERAEFYRRLSSDLQAMAVRGFNEIMMNINEDNYIAVFLFSSMMGKHAFCETFLSVTEGLDFGKMLDQFADSMKLIRGILVVMDGFWEALGKSELKLLLQEGSYLSQGTPPDEECKPLREMLTSADLSAKSIQTYNIAVTELQRAFTAERAQDSSDLATSTAFAWLVKSSEDYTNCLQERRPEALVILAFYAILLHRKQHSWTVQGAGKFIVLAIKDYLGSRWTHWLELPLAAIGESVHSSTGTPTTQEFQSPMSFA